MGGNNTASIVTRPGERFDGVKVFSATMVAERVVLGETVTRWLSDHTEIVVVEFVVSQSSDSRYHCISICVFFRRREPNASRKRPR
jgi:hypothetical protein